DPQRNSEQPTTYRVALGNRACLAREHQEGGLEGVLGILLMAQHAPAHSKHHRPITLHQGCKRLFIPLRQEPLEQMAVANISSIGGGNEPADVMEDSASRAVCHKRTQSSCEDSSIGYSARLRGTLPEKWASSTDDCSASQLRKGHAQGELLPNLKIRIGKTRAFDRSSGP